MGPALRPTPLSPAVGFRGKRFTPGVFKAPCRPKPIGGDVVTRRSRRCRFRQGPVRVRRPFPTARQFRDRGFDQGFKQFRITRRLCGSSAKFGNSDLADFAPSRLQRFEIRWPESSAISSLHRAASRRRVEAVPKSLLPRRPFGLCLGRANPRLDVWKMRRTGESGNRNPGELSTFVRMASGQGWITQRLAAESAAYPLSRCASSRSRRALSLMKPAASCWS